MAVSHITGPGAPRIPQRRGGDRPHLPHAIRPRPDGEPSRLPAVLAVDPRDGTPTAPVRDENSGTGSAPPGTARGPADAGTRSARRRLAPRPVFPGQASRALSDEGDAGPSKAMRHNHKPRPAPDRNAIVRWSR
ncbi:hypothetical protein M446_0734 [Methylobacterium sp. 4-46]|nr:hypothetical protein M446_0734 [Methylobacterium sp. 4-46]